MHLAEIQHLEVVGVQLLAGKAFPTAPVLTQFKTPNGQVLNKKMLAGMLPDELQAQIGLKPVAVTETTPQAEPPKPRKALDYSQVTWAGILGAGWLAESIELIVKGGRFLDVMVTFRDPSGGEQKRKVPIDKLTPGLKSRVDDLIAARAKQKAELIAARKKQEAELITAIAKQIPSRLKVRVGKTERDHARGAHANHERNLAMRSQENHERANSIGGGKKNDKKDKNKK